MGSKVRRGGKVMRETCMKEVGWTRVLLGSHHREALHSGFNMQLSLQGSDHTHKHSHIYKCARTHTHTYAYAYALGCALN